MWWSIVVQERGQSMQEATANPSQFLCAYDGAVHGDRRAKKMARSIGHEYIRAGGSGQPRLVKTPLEPFGEGEWSEVATALDRGLVPPGMTLAATSQLLGAMHSTDSESVTREALTPEVMALLDEYAIDFWEVEQALRSALLQVVENAPPGRQVILPSDWTFARLVASVQGDALILKLTAGLTLLGAVAVAVLFENVPLVRDGEASRNTPDAVR